MNQQPQAQNAGAQQVQMRLLRPEQLATLPVLSAAEKQKYEEGLRKLWQSMKDNGPETQPHIQAKQKVAEFSRMVYQKIQTLQMRQQQAAQVQAQAQAQANAGQVPQQMAQAVPNQAVPNAAQRAQVQAARPQGQIPGNAAAGNATAPNAAAAAPRPQTQIPQNILDHTNSLPWSVFPIPPQLQQEQRATWLRSMKQKYASSLWSMEGFKGRIQQLENHIKEKAGSLPQEELKKFTDQREAAQKQYTEAQKLVSHVRQQLSSATGQNAQQARPQPAALQTQNAGANHSIQAATASVNAAMNAAKNQQLAAGHQAQTPITGQPQVPQTPGTPATPSTAAPQQPPHPAPAAPVAIKTEPGTQQQPQPPQPPPPVNTSVAASTANMPSAATPTQAAANRVQTPQAATPATATVAAGPVRPLTHAAAVNRANSSTNVNGQPANGANGASTTPGSAGAMAATQQAGHPHAHPQPNAASMNAKMPIPKNLPEKATAVPTAVNVGGGVANGRPTYSAGSGVGGGVMNQPVIAKNNAVYNFDADGDHVLSKKKLDELVRQVVGGGTATDAAYLTPDVEESVLHVADAFVDNVINEACQMAKQRGSKVLEIRDLQLVIERVYNLRIPGYTSDELRTVRKAQPSAQYYSKLSAVQAAKIMPTNRDEN